MKELPLKISCRGAFFAQSHSLFYQSYIVARAIYYKKVQLCCNIISYIAESFGLCPPGATVSVCSSDIPFCMENSEICNGFLECQRGEDEFLCESTGKKLLIILSFNKCTYIEA